MSKIVAVKSSTDVDTQSESETMMHVFDVPFTEINVLTDSPFDESTDSKVTADTCRYKSERHRYSGPVNSATSLTVRIRRPAAMSDTECGNTVDWGCQVNKWLDKTTEKSSNFCGNKCLRKFSEAKA